MAPSRIDETLKNLMQQNKSTMTSKNSSKESSRSDQLGDPDCPICHGVGYIQYDVPVGHPQFGKIEPCVCRASQITAAVRDRLFSYSHLDELDHLTFDNFKQRGQLNLPRTQAESLQVAFNAAKRFAGKLEGWLLLRGTYGCGKTHLAAAVGNSAVQLAVPTLFLTVPDLLDSLRFSYESPDTTFEEQFDRIRNIQLLILDDFGTQNATPWAQEKLFQIINYRYINKLPTVITTNLDIADIEPRIRSRLTDPELVTKVEITAPDFRQPGNDTTHNPISTLSSLSSKTFANFSDRKDEKLNLEERRSLDKAVKAAVEFAKKPKGWLIISGGYGTGKTHLAASIANFIAEANDPPLFIMVPDLLDHLRATFSPASATSYDRLFDEVRHAPVLILDDLGSQSSTPWAQEKLFQLLNHRYINEAPTVITIADEQLGKIDTRVGTRLMDNRLCKPVKISAPSFFKKKAIQE